MGRGHEEMEATGLQELTLLSKGLVKPSLPWEEKKDE